MRVRFQLIEFQTQVSILFRRHTEGTPSIPLFSSLYRNYFRLELGRGWTAGGEENGCFVSIRWQRDIVDLTQCLFVVMFLCPPSASTISSDLFLVSQKNPKEEAGFVPLSRWTLCRWSWSVGPNQQHCCRQLVYRRVNGKSASSSTNHQAMGPIVQNHLPKPRRPVTFRVTAMQPQNKITQFTRKNKGGGGSGTFQAVQNQQHETVNTFK